MLQGSRIRLYRRFTIHNYLLDQSDREWPTVFEFERSSFWHINRPPRSTTRVCQDIRWEGPLLTLWTCAVPTRRPCGQRSVPVDCAYWQDTCKHLCQNKNQLMEISNSKLLTGTIFYRSQLYRLTFWTRHSTEVRVDLDRGERLTQTKAPPPSEETSFSPHVNSGPSINGTSDFGTFDTRYTQHICVVDYPTEGEVKLTSRRLLETPTRSLFRLWWRSSAFKRNCYFGTEVAIKMSAKRYSMFPTISRLFLLFLIFNVAE
jgi:hypothetical protein